MVFQAASKKFACGVAKSHAGCASPHMCTCHEEDATAPAASPGAQAAHLFKFGEEEGRYTGLRDVCQSTMERCITSSARKPCQKLA